MNCAASSVPSPRLDAVAMARSWLEGLRSEPCWLGSRSRQLDYRWVAELSTWPSAPAKHRFSCSSSNQPGAPIPTAVTSLLRPYQDQPEAPTPTAICIVVSSRLGLPARIHALLLRTMISMVGNRLQHQGSTPSSS
uniref:Uncharacterized protein n=1 Tax=Arundo donax TaxID=35708 RepID=A0A0A8YP91_ARUDO